MDQIKVNILNAAEAMFLKNGTRQTNMTQVAKAADVSRQTVYAHFENKDALIAAVTRQLMTKMIAQLQENWAKCETLSEKLDVFFRISALEPFEILQTHPELKGLLLGASERTAAVAAQAGRDKANALSKQLEAYDDALKKAGTSSDDLGDYIAQVSKNLKYTASSRSELERHLGLLAQSIRALVGKT